MADLGPKRHLASIGCVVAAVVLLGALVSDLQAHAREIERPIRCLRQPKRVSAQPGPS